MNPLSVFIVDDNQDFAESLADILELYHYQVEMAFDGESALEKFRQKTFDITFLDVKLPGMSGVESFVEMRKIAPQAKVMMMTGHGDEELLKQALENGALGILQKPVEIPTLLKLLEDLSPAGLILLADDDQDFVKSLEDVLTDHGYKVLVAYTGQEAIDRTLANNIDVLVLDLELPVLSGLEVYLQLKENNVVIPTIIVTGYPAEEAQQIDALRAMSVTRCFIKPFEPIEILNAIQLATTSEE